MLIKLLDVIARGCTKLPLCASTTTTMITIETKGKENEWKLKADEVNLVVVRADKARYRYVYD